MSPVCHCDSIATVYSDCCGWECDSCSSPSCRVGNMA